MIRVGATRQERGDYARVACNNRAEQRCQSLAMSAIACRVLHCQPVYANVYLRENARAHACAREKGCVCRNPLA